MTPAYVHLLVIDDDEKQRARLTRPFPSWGWGSTYSPSDPRTALTLLAERPYDLVLLDLKAAERDHYAFLRGRRADQHLAAVPVVITGYPGASLNRLARCIEMGASDIISHPDHHILTRARLQNVLQRKLLQEQARTALEAFNEIEKIADDLRLVILPIGAALSAEIEYDHLIARIVAEAQSICNADAGALYLAQDDGTLHTSYVHIRSLDFTYQDKQESSGTGELFAYLPLADPGSGEPNYESLPVYVALTGETVNLTEIDGARYDLSRLTAFDNEQDYRPQTCLAVPLRSGQIVGSLLLTDSRHPFDQTVVPFDEYHQQVAESLASQAAVVLNNRLLSERQGRLMRYKRELEIGREIQLGFLPARLPSPPGWEVEARFYPALEVAGDFYDAFLLPHGHIVLVIADVVGKGISAALFMAIVRSLFRGLFQQNYFTADSSTAERAESPAAAASSIDREALVNAVRLTNAYLITNHGADYAFATLFAGVLDPGSGRLLYVNAGHNPPMIAGENENGVRAVREELSPTGPAIGLLPNSDFKPGETTLRPDDLLFAYTDGVTEARDLQAEEFGLERLEALVVAHGGSAEGVLAAVEAALDEHAAEAEAFDDVTMLAVRRVQAPRRNSGEIS